MFKTLVELFKKENLIDQAIAETEEMINEDMVMFKESVRALRKSDSAELRIDIREKDAKINKYEREVRKKVITHLAIVGGGQSLTAGLVLTSIVIDVERIGDYTKNIADLALLHPNRLSGGMFEEKIKIVEAEITKKFAFVKKSFARSDVRLAKELMTNHQTLSKDCDKLVKSLIKEKDKSLSAGDAVTLAVYIRFLKRISAHLTNIVSSVANPFHRIGFGEKKKKSR